MAPQGCQQGGQTAGDAVHKCIITLLQKLTQMTVICRTGIYVNMRVHYSGK